MQRNIVSEEYIILFLGMFMCHMQSDDDFLVDIVLILIPDLHRG